MPRYFFHLRDSTFFPDHQGVELPGPAETFVEAARMASQTLLDAEMETLAGKPWQVEVTDERGRLLYTLHLSIQLPQPGD